jgi:hypothetical protein
MVSYAEEMDGIGPVDEHVPYTYLGTEHAPPGAHDARTTGSSSPVRFGPGTHPPEAWNSRNSPQHAHPSQRRHQATWDRTGTINSSYITAMKSWDRARPCVCRSSRHRQLFLPLLSFIVCFNSAVPAIFRDFGIRIHVLIAHILPMSPVKYCCCFCDRPDPKQSKDTTPWFALC